MIRVIRASAQNVAMQMLQVTIPPATPQNSRNTICIQPAVFRMKGGLIHIINIRSLTEMSPSQDSPATKRSNAPQIILLRVWRP